MMFAETEKWKIACNTLLILSKFFFIFMLLMHISLMISE